MERKSYSHDTIETQGLPCPHRFWDEWTPRIPWTRQDLVESNLHGVCRRQNVMPTRGADRRYEQRAAIRGWALPNREAILHSWIRWKGFTRATRSRIISNPDPAMEIRGWNLSINLVLIFGCGIINSKGGKTKVFLIVACFKPIKPICLNSLGKVGLWE